MIAELVDAIVQDLTDHGLEVKEFNYKDLVTKDTITLQRPSVSVIVSQSKAKQVSRSTYKYILTVSLLVTVGKPKQTPTGERAKKTAVYELLEAIAQTIQLKHYKKEGLELENPLIPMGFKNITPYELYKASFQVYQINFWTSYNVTWQDPEDRDRGTLEKILNTYYLTDSTSTTAADLLTLRT